MKCPKCKAEMESEFLCHDEPRFDGTAVFFYICYDCDYAESNPVPKHLINYYRIKYGFVKVQP